MEGRKGARHPQLFGRFDARRFVYYDGDGRRVKKRGWINGQWEETIFVYDASSRLVAEYSTILNPTPQVAYLTADHLGSPRINTNELGTVISRHDYRPYGEEITERTHAEYIGDTIRKQFTGYDWDLETELSFAVNRQMDSRRARFTSPDPYKIVAEAMLEKDPTKAQQKLERFLKAPQKWNSYAYVVNNPLKYTDPTGEEIWLRGTEKEIREAENLIREIIGQKRYDKFVKRLNHNGDDGYALVLNINEEDIEQFTEIDHGDGEAGLRLGMADLLSSTTVTEVRTDGNFINANGDLTRADSDAVCGRVGACLIPAYANINKHQQVVISPDSVEEANEAAKKQPGISSDGKPLTFTKTMILAHELGHAWRRSNNGALGFENAIRRRDKSNIRTRVAEQ